VANKVAKILAKILDIAPNVQPASGARRSGRWPAIQRAFLRKHPTCAVCGSNRNLNAHHIIPFEYGGAELDPDNLITLCCGTFNCHLLFGHLGNYTAANPLVRADAEVWRFRFRARRVLLRLVKKAAKK